MTARDVSLPSSGRVGSGLWNVLPLRRQWLFPLLGQVEDSEMLACASGAAGDCVGGSGSTMPG